jgi:Zn-dependent protease with chaperone function
MTSDQWAELVRRLEPKARSDPRSYGRKVAAFGALGYAFIGLALLTLVALGVLVVILALAGPGVLLKLLLPIAALGWLILRSLSVRMDPPEGIELRREDAPELFRMINAVNEDVRGPKVHKVLIDPEPNAAIVQIPRRGVILGQRNYLVIGLPYLQALSPDELRAVVAHELGHLSRSHGRFGAWIYRIRTTWWQLLEALEEKRHWTTGIFRRFFEWYVPRFDAYSFPLRRAHEFEADEAAAKAAGPQAAATALLSGTLGARHLYEEYWPSVYRRTDSEAEPPRSAFSPMSRELAAARTRRGHEHTLKEELTRQPDVADTHPPLAERISHLGLDPEEVVRLVAANGAGPTAAEAFLGELEGKLAAEFDRAWRESVAEMWYEQHRERQHARRELEALEERASAAELSLEEARTLAVLTAEFRDGDAAVERYRAVLAIDDRDAQANLGLGLLLLERGDDAGLVHLDRAIDADPEAVLPACEAAIEYLEARGRSQEAEKYRRRGESQIDVYQQATLEREEVNVDDELEPPNLDEELIGRIRAAVARQQEVATAYVVRKRLRHLADEYPLYVIALIPAKRWRQLWKETKAEDSDETTLAERVTIDLELPVDFHVVVPGPRSGMDERLEQIPGAKIFTRN